MFCRHVFGNISGRFRGISRVRDCAKYQKPCINGPKFCSGCYCLVSNHSDYYYLAWQAYVCYLVVVQKPRILKDVAK